MSLTPADARLAFEKLFIVAPKSAPIAEPPQAPVISIQPMAQTKYLLQTASFFVEASGTAPLTIQWRHDGENIAAGLTTEGAEGEDCRTVTSRYSHTPETLNDNGARFDCVITNAAGSVISDAAMLLVKRAPEKTASEHAMAFLQTRNSIIKQIKSKERKMKKGIYDFEKEKAAEDKEARFDPYPFYRKLRPAIDLIYRGGETADELGRDDPDDDSSTFAALAGSGYRVRRLDKRDPVGNGHRDDTPAWLLDERCLPILLVRLALKKMKLGARMIEGKGVIPPLQYRVTAAGLDYQILYWYYRLRHEDSEIFERFEDEFREEKGKQRITSSAEAVKKRRERLVKAGNAIFPPQPEDE